jgi:hypothetical protein
MGWDYPDIVSGDPPENSQSDNLLSLGLLVKRPLCCTNYPCTRALIFPLSACLDSHAHRRPALLSASRFWWGRDPSRRFPASAFEMPHYPDDAQHCEHDCEADLNGTLDGSTDPARFSSVPSNSSRISSGTRNILKALHRKMCGFRH